MQKHIIDVPAFGIKADNIAITNHTFDAALYTETNDDIPVIYERLHKYILSLPFSTLPITLSPDYAISSATIAAIAEKHMMCETVNNIERYLSPVKVIYFTPISRIAPLENISTTDFENSVLSNVFDYNEESYTNHQFMPDQKNFMLVGLNDSLLTDQQALTHRASHELETMGITYYTANNIRNNIETMIDQMTTWINNNPIHVVIDLSVLSVVHAPLVRRNVDKTKDIAPQIDGLTNMELITILSALRKANIVGVDITGFHFFGKDDSAIKTTIGAAKLPLTCLFSHLTNDLLDISLQSIMVATPDDALLISAIKSIRCRDPV